MIKTRVQIIILFIIVMLLLLAAAVILAMTASTLFPGFTIQDLHGAWPIIR